jgi:malonate-semialdehyde dehydrogenase (acetylating)/methylmalonate-semialdehyde dehydrogenase
MSIEKLKYFVNGQWKESRSSKHMNIYNPSTGEIIAHAPCCNADEVREAVESAKKAYPDWSNTPPLKRVQVLFRFRELIQEHFDDLVLTLCKEQGKVISESQGDVLKAKEIIEFACGIPSLMMGESLMNVSSGYDTVKYLESLGVFVGISPFNFPAMIPMGWMLPLCIATGNTIVLKLSDLTPMTAIRMMELLNEAGLPEGVANVITCCKEEAKLLLEHPEVKGVTFVGSTAVGRHIYKTAAENGKRVQALCQAKNHALILEDTPLERTARSIINASYGCAGERCMALPAIVVQESIADRLVSYIEKFASELKVGCAYHEDSQMGPLVTEAHLGKVLGYIEKGIKEGADLVLDGRNLSVKGFENGFYLGPCIFDHVKPGMSVGDEEIFGPILSVKRVKDFEEGLSIMNASPFANGSAIFTQNGYYAREFAKRTHAGMVGVNVGIPVPVGMFPFSGHKDSFFGDLHTLGKDGIKFFTESKSVTTRWFDEKEMKNKNVDTWDGTIDLG